MLSVSGVGCKGQQEKRLERPNAGGENQVQELRLCAYEYRQPDRPSISPLYEAVGQ